MRHAYLAPIAALFIAAYSYAEIYKWSDEKGILHFSDMPPASNSNQEEQQNINTNTKAPILKKIVGTWISARFKSNNESIKAGEIAWIICDDGTMIWLDRDGRKYTAEYSVESDNSLYNIDINYGAKIVRTSFKFIDEQTMLVAMKKDWSAKDGERLILTDPKVNQITLKKIDNGGEIFNSLDNIPVSNQARAFIADFQKAMRLKNIKLLNELHCWDGVTEETKQLTINQTEYLLNRNITITDINIIEPTENYEPYVFQGNKYHMNLKVTKVLLFEYFENKEQGSNFGEFSFPLGEKNGKLYIALSKPLKE